VKVLVIDNFDSFTYNLVQYLGELGGEISVYRNDAVTPGQVLDLNPDRVLISPGPGGPEDAGVSRDVIRSVAGRIPLLGVCLGHQCLGQVYGGRIVRALPIHGKTSNVTHDGLGVFTGLPTPLSVARYHSLVVDPADLDPDISITAQTEDGLVMGMRNEALLQEGIQFHPESFMTEMGMQMMRNFLAGNPRP
jgi:anthranilate synthase/aminodeoxychorismate synthase-like glutamine amidotransferase